jgi:uncharacterized protein Yka (UPF0111/DUF47 family)
MEVRTFAFRPADHNVEELVHRLKEIEHRGDEMSHNILTKLNRIFQIVYRRDWDISKR